MKRFFPIQKNVNINKLQISEQGEYSISRPDAAAYITSLVRQILKPHQILVDATANVGGNTLDFAKSFTNLIAIEISPEEFRMLKNNIHDVYKKRNVKLINDDCMVYLYDTSFQYDAVFLDPPWGGPTYKDKTNIDLFLQNINLIDIVRKLINLNKKVILKLPFNFNIYSLFASVIDKCNIEIYDYIIHKRIKFIIVMMYF